MAKSVCMMLQCCFTVSLGDYVASSVPYIPELFTKHLRKFDESIEVDEFVTSRKQVS